MALVDITVDHLKDAISSLITVASEVQLLPIGADCSKEEDVENAIAATVERFGRLDVCFNAAGVRIMLSEIDTELIWDADQRRGS